MFIKANVKATIRGKDAKYSIQKDYVGNVPEWVEQHPYFKSLCQDGSIVFIDSKKDSVLEKANAKAVEERKHNEEVAKQKREMDTKIEQATKEAEQKAVEQGLDEITKNNFIKQEVEKAIKKK